MPLPQPKQTAQDDNGPPKDLTPSQIVADLLARGRPPFMLVNFPRFDESGEPICKVHLRLLTLHEEDVALGRARKYVRSLLQEKVDDLPWRPEELEHNARVVEILAVACREPGDPEKPLFRHGAPEARRYFTSDEIGVLANHYATLKLRTHPRLSEMTDTEMDEWIRVIAQGWAQNPFAYFSREQLETLCGYAARCLAAREAQPTGQSQTPSSSSDSIEPST